MRSAFPGMASMLVLAVSTILAELVTEGGTQREIAAFAPERLMDARAAA